MSCIANASNNTTTITYGPSSYTSSFILQGQYNPVSGGGGSGGSSNPGGGGSGITHPIPSFAPLKTSVPNGSCVIGAVASALEAMGADPATVLKQAENALRNRNIDPFPNADSNGISLSIVDLSKVMRDLGFTVVGAVDPAAIFIRDHFRNGGWGLGLIPPENNGGTGHQVFLTGYNSTLGSYIYYDATEVPGYEWGIIGIKNVNDFLIKSNVRPRNLR